ncbi:hypothetical protein SAMN02746041_01518 [Desulfacinum hydrothermale DSM 13146]|uniref:Uncharacterized protein n=1 Tax=Desulfacinum hydrothermale DSM 13146 TaxID=1121390 RepID=A0A1W1XGD1_9BACT|nr:hypothetical protein [Desulfacinum hydrothermale]SMC22571.1 hypothetical protein SAMN02746041_01518 [Desulfacinum hydrothermale DSM 13146]
MGEVVNFKNHRHEKAAARAFRIWRPLLGRHVRLDAGTCWSDLPDSALFFLCRETPESKLAFYDFLMGALGLGSGHELEQQAPRDLIDLLNAYFYFLDQARFECCRRLDWTEPTGLAMRPLIEQVLDPAAYDYPNLMQCPVPTPQHPAYEAYRAASGMDRCAVLRRWLPEAVERFGWMVDESTEHGPPEQVSVVRRLTVRDDGVRVRHDAARAAPGRKESLHRGEASRD